MHNRRMAVFGIRLCLPVLLACVVSMSVVQGRNLRRRHNHHSYPDYLDFEESIPRDLSRSFKDDWDHPYRRQMERRESSQILDPMEYEERISPHRKHDVDLKNYAESLRRKNEPRRQKDVEDVFVVRRKRHNRHGGTTDHQKFSDQLWYLSGQYNRELELPSTSDSLHTFYEREVKEAQNSSICNYTVESIPIPDNRTTRTPKDLEHVKCNYVGSSCQDTGNYCCIQTYRNIEVSYDDGEDKKLMKIYVGCVCALQDFDNNLVESPLRIND